MLEPAKLNNLEKAIMEFIRMRNYEATCWDIVCYVSGYCPECTTAEIVEIIHRFIQRGIEVEL